MVPDQKRRNRMKSKTKVKAGLNPQPLPPGRIRDFS
jgi:hypothetical protein